MKRTALKRGKPLERGKPLKRGGPLKRKPKPKPTALERELQEGYARGIRRESCCSCGRAAPAVTIRAHHVLRRKVLEAALKARGWALEEILRAAWDRRNRLAVCDDCHMNHHNGTRRLSINLIVKCAPTSITFARELDLLEELKRDYTD